MVMQLGKQLAFDGKLLHGAPASLALLRKDKAQTQVGATVQKAHGLHLHTAGVKGLVQHGFCVVQLRNKVPVKLRNVPASAYRVAVVWIRQD